MKILKDYKTVLHYHKKKGNIKIEDVNEVLLSSKYYPKYGEYGVENFLNYYAEQVKDLLLARQAEKVDGGPVLVKMKM